MSVQSSPMDHICSFLKNCLFCFFFFLFRAANYMENAEAILLIGFLIHFQLLPLLDNFFKQ